MTSEELITLAIADGKTHQQIQGELRQGWDQDAGIPTEAAIEALAMGLESVLTMTVKLFVEAIQLSDVQVDGELMVQAYLDAFRLSQDAYFYDHFNKQPDDEEYPGQMSIDDISEEE